MLPLFMLFACRQPFAEREGPEPDPVQNQDSGELDTGERWDTGAAVMGPVTSGVWYCPEPARVVADTGPSVLLVEGDERGLSFVPSGTGLFDLRLLATSDQDSDKDRLRVEVGGDNTPPSAQAADAGAIALGSLATLSASVSHDPDEDTLSFTRSTWGWPGRLGRAPWRWAGRRRTTCRWGAAHGGALGAGAASAPERSGAGRLERARRGGRRARLRRAFSGARQRGRRDGQPSGHGASRWESGTRAGATPMRTDSVTERFWRKKLLTWSLLTMALSVATTWTLGYFGGDWPYGALVLGIGMPPGNSRSDSAFTCAP